jgi:MOSC domain-containing protein YiiM
MATLLTLSVSPARTFTHHHHDDGRQSEWTSGIFKQAVQGKVWVGTLNIAGDQQADLKNHGGEHQAVMAYSAEHYALWRAELPDIPWTHGGFGENFTIAGQDERTVCIGDVYAIGAVRLQVSAPRFPCWKLARRWQHKELAARVDANLRSGWYLRTLQEGEVEAGMTIERIERPYPQFSIYSVHQVFDDFDDFVDVAEQLADCPAFKPSLRQLLSKKLAERSR